MLVAVNGSRLPDALAGLPPFEGRIVIATDNPIEALFEPIALHGRTSSEAFARLVPDERVVKAFNHLRPASRSADPVERGGRRVMFLTGDDARAHATVTTVTALIDRLGFAGIDLGTLAEGGRRSRFPGGPSSALELVRCG